MQVQMQVSADRHSVVHFTNMRCVVSKVVKSFRLKLQVADMGGMGLTSEGVAVIHVADINNHAPQFSPASVSLSLQHMSCCCFSYNAGY